MRVFESPSGESKVTINGEGFAPAIDFMMSNGWREITEVTPPPFDIAKLDCAGVFHSAKPDEMPPQCVGDPRDIEAAFNWKMDTPIVATSRVRFGDWQRLVDAFQSHREAAEKPMAELKLIGTRKPKTMVDEMIIELHQLRQQVADLKASESRYEQALKWANVRRDEIDAENRGLREALRIAEKKNASSLANNLCPDHRDKQQGKPCLACEVEMLRRKLVPHEAEGGA